jgi:glycosyltransferase involved in cell wall biosynthesis
MPRNTASRREPPLVCVIGLRGMPGVMGGVESHCEELLPRLARRAADLHLLVLGRRPHMGSGERLCGGVRVVPLPAPKRQGIETLVSSFLGVLYARRARATAVHIHALASGLLVPLARLLGMKVILTVHGADYERAKWGPAAKALLRLGERLGVGNSNAVICVAPSLASKLQDRYPKRARLIEFVPNGAPALRPLGRERDVLARFGLTRNEFVLTVGRVEPGKGFDLLIDAFRKSRRKGKLVIVGGAHHEADYAAQLGHSADERVIFTGVLPRETLAHLYRSAGLFVLPSLHEGLPICALEAGSAGCPLLLSDIPGNRDLGLPDIHYFRSGDADSLSEALRARASLYAVSAQMFDSFDWEDIASKTLAIYDAVMGNPAEAASYVAA